MHAHFCLKQRGHNMCKRRFLVSEKWLHGVLLFCCWLFEAGLCGHQLRGLPGDGRPGVEACGPPSHFQLFFPKVGSSPAPAPTHYYHEDATRAFRGRV
jgi:hypothetical protein